jgi:NAD(P)-dependent dehydrogenase (short-subunit alcohol dehydrogenase family)
VTTLQDRVVIVTGAGHGIGREHALLFAAEGAKVVVNDLGGNVDGTGAGTSAAQRVADEILAAGGEAVANHDDVASWDGAQRLVEQAVDTFGDLHVLVNNAGILRDRMLVNMTEGEWDDVIRVHLKGHFCPTRHAAAYWRARSKASHDAKRAIVNTSSTSGLFGNVGQGNYGAAKMGIAALTMIAADELARFNVRVNAIAPAAFTRMSEGVFAAESAADWRLDPANISPFVAYLATEDCPVNGRCFFVMGGEVSLFQPFALIDKIEKDGRWTVGELQRQAARLADVKFTLNNPWA